MSPRRSVVPRTAPWSTDMLTDDGHTVFRTHQPVDAAAPRSTEPASAGPLMRSALAPSLTWSRPMSIGDSASGTLSGQLTSCRCLRRPRRASARIPQSLHSHPVNRVTGAAAGALGRRARNRLSVVDGVYATCHTVREGRAGGRETGCCESAPTGAIRPLAVRLSETVSF